MSFQTESMLQMDSIAGVNAKDFKTKNRTRFSLWAWVLPVHLRGSKSFLQPWVFAMASTLYSQALYLTPGKVVVPDLWPGIFASRSSGSRPGALCRSTTGRWPPFSVIVPRCVNLFNTWPVASGAFDAASQIIFIV
ncbi:hypothetical protein VDGL01_10518 [Verticillium dahliae]